MAVKTPLPIITNGFRVAHEYHTADATFVNVYWCGAGDATDAISVGTIFIGGYESPSGGSGMRALHSADVTFDQVVVTPLDGESPSETVLYAAGVHGTGTSPAAAANAAGIITWETGIRGRAFRGRSFLGGLPAGLLETGGARWGTSWVSDANSWVQNTLDAWGVADPALFLMVVSQHSETGPHHTQVQSFIPRRGVGTQRGRTERSKP